MYRIPETILTFRCFTQSFLNILLQSCPGIMINGSFGDHNPLWRSLVIGSASLLSQRRSKRLHKHRACLRRVLAHLRVLINGGLPGSSLCDLLLDAIVCDADGGLDPEILHVILTRWVFIGFREGGGSAGTLKSRHFLSHGMYMLNLWSEHKLLPLVPQFAKILVDI